MLVCLVGFRETIRNHLLTLGCAVCLVFGFPLTGWWEQTVNGSTVFDLFVDPFVLFFLLVGFVNDLDEHFWWNNYEAVVITNADVVWLHGGATASNGCVHFPWHVTTTQHSGVVTVGVDRDANFSYGSSVTDTAVGDHSVCAANLGTHGQDVTEGSGTFFTACFHDDDVVWLYGV